MAPADRILLQIQAEASGGADIQRLTGLMRHLGVEMQDVSHSTEGQRQQMEAAQAEIRRLGESFAAGSKEAQQFGQFANQLGKHIAAIDSQSLQELSNRFKGIDTDSSDAKTSLDSLLETAQGMQERFADGSNEGARLAQILRQVEVAAQKVDAKGIDDLARQLQSIDVRGDGAEQALRQIVLLAQGLEANFSSGSAEAERLAHLIQRVYNAIDQLNDARIDQLDDDLRQAGRAGEQTAERLQDVAARARAMAAGFADGSDEAQRLTRIAENAEQQLHTLATAENAAAAAAQQANHQVAGLSERFRLAAESSKALIAAATGLGSALFVNEIKEMAFEADQASKNVAYFGRVMLMYGQNVDEAREKTNAFALQMGVSRNEMQNTIATLIKSGLSLQQATQVTERALDSGSQLGRKASDTMDALGRVFISYNSDALEGIGVNENFGDSISKLGNNASNSEKAMVAYNLIMKATTTDAGTHRKSLEGLNGVMSQQESAYRELRREIGGAFLPVITEGYKTMLTVTRGLLDWVKASGAARTAAQFVTAGMGFVRDAFAAAGKFVGQARKDFSVFEPTLHKLAQAFGFARDRVEPLAKSLQKAEAPSVTLRDVFKAIARVTEPVADGVKVLADNLDTVAVMLGTAGAAYVLLNGGALLATAGTAAFGAATAVAASAVAVLTAPITLVTLAVGALYVAWKNNFGGLHDQTDQLVRNWQTVVVPFWKDTFGKLKAFVAQFAADWAAGWKLITGKWDEFKTNWTAGVVLLRDWFTKRLPEAFQKFKDIFAWKADDTPFMAALKAVPNLFISWTDNLGKLWDKAKSFFGWLKGAQADAPGGNGQTETGNTADPTIGNAPKTTGSNHSADYYAKLAPDTLSKAIVEATFGKTGNRAADELVNWCARWTRLTLEKAQPSATNTIERWFGGDANDIKKRVGGSGKMRKNLGELQPGDVVIYDDNHVGIYIGDGLVRGNNRVTNARGGGPVGNVKLEGLGKVVGYARVTDFLPGGATPGKAGGGGAGGAGGTPDPAADAAARKKIQQQADDWAKQMFALQERLEKATSAVKKAAIQREIDALDARVKKWSEANQKIVADAYGNLYGPLLAHQRNLADDAQAQAEKARAAQRKATEEARGLAAGTLAYRQKVAQGVITAYELEVAAAGDSAEKKLAVEKGWQAKVVAARKELLRVQAEQDKAARQKTLSSTIYDDDGKLKVSAATAKKEKALAARDIAQIDSTLKSALAKVDVDFTNGLAALRKTASQEGAALATVSAAATLSAAETAAGTRLKAAERAYLEDLALAEGSAQKIEAVEKKHGQRLRQLRDAQAKAERDRRVAEENEHFAQQSKQFTDKGKAVPQSVKSAHSATLADIEGDYKGALAGNARQVKDLMTRARHDLKAEMARVTQEETAIQQQALENRFKAGKLAWADYEKQRLALVLKGLAAERDAALIGVKDAKERARITAQYQGKMDAERLGSEKDLNAERDRLLAQHNANALAALDNRLAQGKIKYEAYAKERLKLTLAGLEVERKTALDGLVKGSAQWLAVNQEYDLKASALRIASENDTRARHLSGIVADNQIAQDELDNRLAAGLVSQGEYEKQRLALTVKGLEAARDAELSGVDRTSTEGLRIIRAYTAKIAGVRLASARSTEEEATRILAQQNQTALQTLDNQLAQHEIGQQEYNRRRAELVVKGLEQERDARLKSMKKGSTEYLTLEADYNARILAQRLAGERTAQDEALRVAQERHQTELTNLDNLFNARKIDEDEYNRRHTDLLIKGLEEERDARLKQMTKGTPEYLAYESNMNAQIQALRIGFENQQRQRVLGNQLEDGRISLNVLSNQLEAQQITWEQYEADRLKGQLANIETSRQQALSGLKEGSADWLRVNKDFDAQVEAARLASAKTVAEAQTRTEEAIANASLAQLQARFQRGELTRLQLADETTKLTLAGIDRQEKAALRATDLTEGQRTAISAQAEADRTTARIQAEKSRAALVLQIAREGIEQETADAQEAREAGRISAAELSDTLLGLTLRRLDNEREAALLSNQDGAEGVKRIWAIYDRERNVAARKAADERVNIELEAQRRVLTQQGLDLQNKFNGGEIGVEEYEQSTLTQQKAGLDLDRRAALAANKDGLNGQYRIWQDYYAKVSALDLDFTAKQRERQRAVTDQNTENSIAALSNQYNAGLLATGDYEKSVLDLEEGRLNRTYAWEEKYGHKTSAELLALWTKLQNDKAALHQQFLDKQRQREIDSALGRLDVEGQQNNNKLESGSMTLEDYEAAERQRQGGINLQNLKRGLLDAKGDSGKQDQAYAAYWAAEDAADIADKKRKAQRAADFRKGQLQLELDALETRVTNEEITEEAAAQERLRINKDMMAAQLKADLDNKQLTVQQRGQIQAAADAKGRQLDAEYQAWLRHREEGAQKDLLSLRIAGLEAQHEAGLMSTEDFLRERQALENTAAYEQYKLEMKAAGDNQAMKDAALLRYQQAVDASGRKVAKTQEDIARTSVKEQIDFDLAALDDLHAAKLIGEAEYLEEKRKLTIRTLEMQREAELATIPESDTAKRAEVTRRYGQAIANTNKDAARSLDELHKASKKAGTGAFESANNWAAMREEMRELEKQAKLTNDPIVKQGLEAQKTALKIKMYGEMAKVAVGLFFEGMKAFGGMGGEVADQWAEDMGRMVDDAVSMAMEVGKALMTGDWVGTIVKGMQIIFGWLTRNRKAAEDAKKAQEDYNKQFRFDKEGYGTRKVETYTTGILFWKTTHYKESVDEASKELALSFEGAVVNGISSGMAEAAEKHDSSIFQKTLQVSLRDAALKGLTDAFLNSAEVAALFGPLVQKLMVAFKSGNKAQINAALSEFKKGVADLKPALDALTDAGAEIWNSLTPPPDKIAQMRDAIKGGIESGVKGGIAEAIKSGDPGNIGKAIRLSVGSTIMDALIDQFMQSAAMQAIIMPAMKRVAAAMATEDPSDDDAAFAVLDRALGQYGDKAAAFAQRVRGSLGSAGLLETAPNVTRTREQSEQDATLQRYLTDGDPSNDEAALRAYRERNGQASGSSMTYTIGSSGQLSRGGNPFEDSFKLLTEAGTSIGAAAKDLLEAGRMMLEAGRTQLQAARIMLQAAGQSYVGNYEAGRMTFNNGGI